MTDTTAQDPPRREHIVETQHLTKRFGSQTAVDDLTMQVRDGTIFGFIGPSGSGKTTTVRLLTGVQSPSEGSAHVMGVEPAAFTERERAKIGYMPQLSVLFPHLSIMENLRFVASIYGMAWGRRAQLRKVLEFVELADDRRKQLRHASGGMQRRLALAAALVNEPQLLFLDEPTAGIDPVLRRKFWDHFESLRDDGRTLFVTTQYVGEAAYCDKIGVLRNGQLLTVDTPEGLRRQAYGGEVIDLVVADRIEQDLITDVTRLEYVAHAQRTRVDGRGMRITVDDADRVIPPLQRWLDQRGVQVESIDRYLPPFDDVFVKLVEADGATELGELSHAAAEQAALEPEITIPPIPDAQPVDDGSPATAPDDLPPATPPSEAPPTTPASDRRPTTPPPESRPPDDGTDTRGAPPEDRR
jgi:ABC-2 type transport system ATP-binding protein